LQTRHRASSAGWASDLHVVKTFKMSLWLVMFSKIAWIISAGSVVSLQLESGVDAASCAMSFKYEFGRAEVSGDFVMVAEKKLPGWTSGG